MIQCDVQGPGCKIWYHAKCVGISKSHGKKMDRDNLYFICPVCSDTAVSAETVEVTTNSRTSLTDSPDMAIPSTISVTASHVSVDLPFSVMPPPAFLWNGTIEGSDFVDRVNFAYDEVVHWKRNLFVVPFGKAGKEFVQELTRLFHC